MRNKVLVANVDVNIRINGVSESSFRKRPFGSNILTDRPSEVASKSLQALLIE
jgi:hypothetical protein